MLVPSVRDIERRQNIEPEKTEVWEGEPYVVADVFRMKAGTGVLPLREDGLPQTFMLSEKLLLRARVFLRSIKIMRNFSTPFGLYLFNESQRVFMQEQKPFTLVSNKKHSVFLFDGADIADTETCVFKVSPEMSKLLVIGLHPDKEDYVLDKDSEMRVVMEYLIF